MVTQIAGLLAKHSIAVCGCGLDLSFRMLARVSGAQDSIPMHGCAVLLIARVICCVNTASRVGGVTQCFRSGPSENARRLAGIWTPRSMCFCLATPNASFSGTLRSVNTASSFAGVTQQDDLIM